MNTENDKDIVVKRGLTSILKYSISDGANDIEILYYDGSQSRVINFAKEVGKVSAILPTKSQAGIVEFLKALAGLQPNDGSIPQFPQEGFFIIKISDQNRIINVHMVTIPTHLGENVSLRFDGMKPMDSSKVLKEFILDNLTQSSSEVVEEFCGTYDEKVSLIFDKDEPITKIIGRIFKASFEYGANGFQIIPGEKEAVVSYIKDNSAILLAAVSPERFGHLLDRLKILAGLKLIEKDKSQGGSFTFNILEQDKTLSATMSTTPTQYGENILIKFGDVKPTDHSKTIKEFITDDLRNL